jgi:DNA excision repair protein ERCC-4
MPLHPPRHVTAEMSADARNAVYLEAGVLFVTSRILVVDMLLGKVPTDLIMGLVVLNGHRVTPTSTEAFILRLYRLNNHEGFIKGFSDNPEALARGFNGVEKTMKALWVRKLFLWPRFHQSGTTPVTPSLSAVHSYSCSPALVFSPPFSSHISLPVRACPHFPCCMFVVPTSLIPTPLSAFCFPMTQHIVTEALESKKQPKVKQVDMNQTPRMQRIQIAIRELLMACLRELKQKRPGLDMEHLSAETALLSEFDRTLSRQLDPVWHLLGASVKQLVKDIRTLRNLVRQLYNYDAVSFFHYLEALRASSTAFNENSSFLFLDATDDLYSNAKGRVFPPKPKVKAEVSAKGAHLSGSAGGLAGAAPAVGGVGSALVEPSAGAAAAAAVVEPAIDPRKKIEVNPKWLAVDHLIKVIAKEAGEGDAGRTLVCVADGKTAIQLADFFRFGAEKVLGDQLLRYERFKGGSVTLAATFANKAPVAGPGSEAGRAAKRRRRKRQTEATGNAAATTIEQVSYAALQDEEIEAASIAGAPDDELLACFGEIDVGAVVICAMKADGVTRSSASLELMLRDVQPRHVILVDPELIAMRQLELYSYATPGPPLSLYLCNFRDSIQEQKFLTSIRLERQAFEALIRAKQMMAVPEDQDGRAGHRQEMERSTVGQTDALTYALGSPAKRSRQEAVRGKVIVDMREFRSSLPSLVHARGMDIVPITLEVGDYVLSPEICVERKSIPDLIGSLNSGRLYTQALAMTRCVVLNVAYSLGGNAVLV